jgi:hypothetical protein
MHHWDALPACNIQDALETVDIGRLARVGFSLGKCRTRSTVNDEIYAARIDVPVEEIALHHLQARESRLLPSYRNTRLCALSRTLARSCPYQRLDLPSVSQRSLGDPRSQRTGHTGKEHIFVRHQNSCITRAAILNPNTSVRRSANSVSSRQQCSCFTDALNRGNRISGATYRD